MRILWTLPYLPWPTTSGGRTRQFHLLRAMAERGHRITLLVQSRSDLTEQARQALEPWLERLIVLPRRALKSPLTLLGLTNPAYPTLTVVNGLAPRLRHEFERLLEEDWDVIQIEHSYSFQPFERALQASRRPFVLIEHNIESAMGICAELLPLWVRPFTAFDRWRYRRWETRVYAQATEVVAVSQRDADYISSMIERPVRVVVNGVDCAHYEQISPALHSQRLLFVGNFEYGPNVDAIEWALEEILPQVWMSNPAVRFAICGHALPSSWKLRWSDPRIEWQDFCQDLRDLQRHSAIFFAPLRYGGGSKLKVLEAMAAGLPVVTTSQGVSGLDVENGQHYLGSDDPADLALIISQLLSQPLRFKQLSEAARTFVCQEHDWSVAANQLESVYAQLLATSRNSPAPQQPEIFGRSTK